MRRSRSARHASESFLQSSAVGVRSVRQRLERIANRRERNAGALRYADDRDAAQHLAGIPALVALVSPAPDEAFRLIKVKR